MSQSAPTPDAPKFSDALKFWWKLGWISFGGPAGQIAIMHQEIVDKRRWMDDDHFLHALNFCMLLPGPEAMQLATYLGWRLHGVRGGIAAGALFVLPSALLLLGLSWLYMAAGDVTWVKGIFDGLEPAVIAIVLSAMLKIGGKTLRTPALWAIAALSFIGIFFLNISFVLIIAGAAATGLIGARWLPSQFPAKQTPPTDTSGQSLSAHAPLPDVPKPTLGRNLRVLTSGLCIWLVPLIAIGAWLGWNGTHFQEGIFFSKAALITFGGAYAVLPYVAQQAVDIHGWLDHGQMMAGLGLAETTPGPLIMVLQFVGFAGGWQHPPVGMSPLTSGTLAAAVTSWTTFLPCFMFIFLGGPYVESMRNKPAIAAALTAITAAVVGVILNLAIWFALHALDLANGGINGFVAIAATLSFAAMKWLKLDLLWVLAACALAGLGLQLI
ncbi:chromate efflux transporter [Sulfuriroseicoccus oceanibius]|uniref:Chromate efflux transporter n=1 Tax=Sulfuriroseicoccus oceanibius TaxID=2707525 RepID=A0A6B3LCV7_9BACT|nr:chromate efflux transporter [Sulfuriroseicoccus oceanibius]QQL44968.1 chromate efflux transporter [Sulfuriroseicoccus oceanibius]